MLPRATAGSGQPLPTWARALAPSLPHTAVALLNLDYMHRAQSPLDPRLRGMIRWTAAEANRCQYSQACALADLRRAAVSDTTIRALVAGDESAFSSKEKAALSFARKLTLNADAVTDTEVARLIKEYGEKQVVGMVLLLAYANFQDRLILALDLPLETTGPLPPLELRFKADLSHQPPQRPPFPNRDAAPPVAERVADPAWAKVDFEHLQKALQGQRARKARIALPDWEKARKSFPVEYQSLNKPAVQWSLVCLGYQPELTAVWFNAMGAFGAESRQDRVLEESLFWVITRAINCFY